MRYLIVTFAVFIQLLDQLDMEGLVSFTLRIPAAYGLGNGNTNRADREDKHWQDYLLQFRYAWPGRNIKLSLHHKDARCRNCICYLTMCMQGDEGKGLGNQFLSVASQSDALIHVVDASGSIDEDGRIADPGTGDPLKDFEEIEGELVAWYVKIMENNRDKVLKLLKSSEPAEALAEPLRGMKIKPSEVAETLSRLNLNGEEFDSWTAGQLWDFAGTLREISKPTIIVANKMDLPGAMKNYKKLRDSHPDLIVVPASAEAELALRKAEQNNLIRYN